MNNNINVNRNINIGIMCIHVNNASKDEHVYNLSIMLILLPPARGPLRRACCPWPCAMPTVILGGNTPSPPTKSLGFRGFDSNKL